MKTFLSALIGSAVLCLTASAQTFPAILWQGSYGGGDRDELANGLILPVPEGGYLLGGKSLSPPGADKAARLWDYIGDWWVVRLDEAGNKLWDKSFAGGRGLVAILRTADGGYLLGGSSVSPANDQDGGDKTAPSYDVGRPNGDIWLVKVDRDFHQIWDKSYGGSDSDHLSAIAPTPDGGFLLAGLSVSPPSGNKSAPAFGLSDGWVIKVDPAGNKLWDRTYGGSASDSFNTIAPTRDGGFLLAGSSSSDVGGTKTAPHFGESDFWLVRIDGNGNQLWDRSYGGAGDDYLSSAVALENEELLLVGGSASAPSPEKSSALRGGTDFWAVRVGPDGTRRWDRSYGGSGYESAWTAVATADGGFLLGGYSDSLPGGNKTASNRGNTDYWLVKIGTDGARQWDQSYGGSGYEYAAALCPSNDGQFVLAGMSYSGPDGNKSTPNLGRFDFWVLKLAASVPPRIAAQPRSVTASRNMSITFSGEVESFTQPLRYQWRFNTAAMPDQTNATLVLPSVQSVQAGRYTVLVSNDYGSVESDPAILTYTDAANIAIAMHPTLTIFGALGKSYRVEYTEDSAEPLGWHSLGTVQLTNSPQLFLDPQAATLGQRLYRVLLVP